MDGVCVMVKVGDGEAVRVCDAVCVGVCVGVCVCEAVCVWEIVCVSVMVCVELDVCVRVCVIVIVCVAVCDQDELSDAVRVCVAVCVGVCVDDDVDVAVLDDVCERVTWAERVLVADGVGGAGGQETVVAVCDLMQGALQPLQSFFPLPLPPHSALPVAETFFAQLPPFVRQQ